MKKIFTTLLIVCSVTLCKAQWVTIPDANFVAWLTTNYPTCMSGNQMNTSCSAIVNATKVVCYNQGIHDLTGIEYFTSINDLECGSNYLTFLPTLPNSLDTLACYSNQLTNLPALPSLNLLTCEDNLLTSLPVLPITLTYFDCSHNQLSSLSSLPNSLLDMIVSFNQLNTISVLPTFLNSLDCSQNALTNLPSLPNSLKYLYCTGNDLIVLPTLSSSLLWLRCSNNQLSTLPILPSSLVELTCNSNSLAALPGLPSLLQTLNCNYNLLTNLPSPLPSALAHLECRSNNLTILPVLPNSIFYYLDCSYNQLTSLPFLSNFLGYLDCSSNQLTFLPQLPNSLTRLICASNQITSIPDLPSVMFKLIVGYNPNLSCLPPIEKINSSNFTDLGIYGTSIHCLPNVIQHSGGVWYPIDTMQLCGIFNPSGCEIAWNIKGSINKDADGSCATVTDGTPTQNIKMGLFDNSNNLLQQVYTTGGGNYSFDTQLGTYNVQVDTTGIPFDVICPVTNNYNSIITAVDSLDYNGDFRMLCKPNYDIGVLSMHEIFPFRPNHVNTVYLDAGDMASYYGVTCNTSGLSGTVTATVSGGVSIISASSIPNATSSASGNVVTWTVNDFSLINFSNTFFIQFHTDSNVVLWSSVCIAVDVNAGSGTDNNISNNSLNQCFTVQSSYDPNTKEADPKYLSTGDEWINYIIHFQNTGTAPAENILVTDTLDSNLDWSTFELTGYSNENMTQVLPNGIVHFNFPNINLPDSTSDEPGSHGFVQYRIKPVTGLIPPVTFNNSAAIYFDFNSPVITDNAVVKFCTPSYGADENYSICTGDSLHFGNDWYFNAGVYNGLLTNATGCDSIVNLNLTVLNPSSNSISVNICAGDNFNFNGVNLSVAGVYSDTLNATNSCDSILTLNLTVETVNTTINQFGDTLIAASFSNVQWFDCNTQQIIPGETSLLFVPDVTGNYSAIITQGNCTDTSACFNVVVDGVGELAVDNFQLALFPNPNSGRFTISSNTKIDKIEITNLLGQIVYRSAPNQKNLSLQLEHSGMYFITVTATDKTVTQKIILQE